MNKKYFYSIVFSIITVFLFSISSFALSGTSYGDLTSTSSQAVNLINYAMSFDDFINSEWVCYRDDTNSYYLVWSDEMIWQGSTVSASDVKYVRYWRENNQASWKYGYGTDNNFTFSTAYLCTSNVPGLGSISEVFESYYYQHNFLVLGVLFTSFILVIAFVSLKGGKK